MKNKITSVIVFFLTALIACGQIVNPITNGILNTDLNAAGFQLDNVGRIGFGTATPTSRLSILPAGNPTTNADGLQLGPDVYIYRSSAGTVSITGNLSVSGTLASSSGIVTLGGVNAWSGINTWAGVSTFNGPITIGNSGLSFSGSGASATRTALSLAVGTNVQAYSARLSEIASLGVSPAGFMYANGTNWVLTPLASVRAAVGLGSSDTPTFAGLTLSAPLAFTSGGLGISSIAVNKTLYSSSSNTLASTDLSPYIRTSILPAADASAAITALTLNTLSGALSGSILSPTLATNAVTTASINTNAVTTAKIADGAVTTVKLAATGATAGTYGGAASIPQFTVNAQGQIVSISAIAATGLTAATAIPIDSTWFTGTYGDPLLRANSITDAQLYATGVAAGTYGAVDSIPQIAVSAAGRITGVVGVPFTGLTVASVTTGDLTGGTYANTVIAANAITTPKLADNSVSTAKISDSAVTTAKLATGAVTTAKITDANVTNVKLAADAVTSDKITDGAIITADIANASITSAKIANDAVALDTQTTGNYVRTISSMTTNVVNSGTENADVTIDLPQALGGGDSPTFAGLRLNGGLTGVVSNGQTITVAASHPNATDSRTGLSPYEAFRPFVTIAAAVAASTDGDRIYIAKNASGVYTENVLWTTAVDVVMDASVTVTGNQVISDSCSFTGGRFNLTTAGTAPTMLFESGLSKLNTIVERFGAASTISLIPTSSAMSVDIDGGRIANIGGAATLTPIIATADQTATARVVTLTLNGGFVGYHFSTVLGGSGTAQLAVDIQPLNILKVSGHTRIDGKVKLAATSSVFTATDNFSNSYARFTIPGTTGVLDNATAAPLVFTSVDSNVVAAYSDLGEYSTTTGVFRPTRRCLITFDGSIGLTPTGLTDVVAGDQVELLLQTSTDGTVWSTKVVLDTYNISIAGGGPIFKLGGTTTVHATDPAGFTSLGGYRLAVKCVTAAGTGANGSYVRSNDLARSFFNIKSSLR